MTEAEQRLFGIEKLKCTAQRYAGSYPRDYSALSRQHKETNPRYYALIQRFNERTGCPVIVNTSFNVRGEPIVGTLEDAFRCFMGTDIEVLAIGNRLLRKVDQDPSLTKDYKSAFEFD